MLEWEYYPSTQSLSVELAIDTSMLAAGVNYSTTSESGVLSNDTIEFSCQAKAMPPWEIGVLDFADVTVYNVPPGIYQLVDGSSKKLLLSVDTSKTMGSG